MKVIILVVLLTSSSLFANRESGGSGRNRPTAVFVDFTSRGTGIDTKSKELLKEAVAKYADKVAEKTVTQYGREGEVRYCLLVTDAYGRFDIISSIAASIVADRELVGGKRTIVSLGSSCNHPEESHEQELVGYIRR